MGRAPWCAIPTAARSSFLLAKLAPRSRDRPDLAGRGTGQGPAGRARPQEPSHHRTGGEDVAIGRVEVRVQDTGDGIPPEHLARIFDLYFTTKKRGSGIGLSLVFRTVQLHNGDIDVESTVGTGTTFVIKLPRAR